ncbi:MAG: hypothetical protein FWG51_04810, partial [Firmicutes bacterium]|nr:hypothetical protein [Bacillota bacterium]
MKKIASLFLGTLLLVALVFGLTANAFNAPSNFADQLKESSVGDVRGPGSSLVMNNADGLGTTTLFSGTSITANGTKDGYNINFNIYGGGGDVDEPELGYTTEGNTIDVINFAVSQDEYYLLPENRAFINTGFVPNQNTTLEIYFMLPEGFISTSEGGAHPDVAGCNGGSGTPHFGGPLLLSNGDIQFLYGSWPANSNILTADFKWAAGNEYYSKLTATPGNANVYITDGTNEYSDSLSYSIALDAYNTLYLFGQNNYNSLVNPVKVGIKEVIISQNGIPEKHFVAVEKGSTEYSLEAAEDFGMFELESGEYVYNNGGGNFSSIKGAGSTIDIPILTGSLTGGGLRGVRVNDDAPVYTYIDGNGHK